MLTVSQISKSFGAELVLSRVSFTANPGERLALVGPNGCGKTTLLRILIGEEMPDSGSVRYSPPNLSIGYLPQGFVFPPGETIGSYIDRCEGNLERLTERLESLAAQIARMPNQGDLQQEYDAVLARLQIAAQNEGRGEGILAHLGIGDFPPDTPVEHLSGGQKTRLALAGALISSPQLLLLDEPTNHLDFEMLQWLEDWLLRFAGTVVYVSHDRAFIDRTATSVLEIDPHTHTLRVFPGNYTAYLEAVLDERDKQMKAYADQQEEISRLRAAARRIRGLAVKKKGGKGDSGDKFATGFFNDQTRGTIARARSLERRLERLMTEDRVEKPRLSWQIPTDFGSPPESGRDVVTLENLSVGYDDLVLLSGINQTIRHGERIAFIGPNGSGKTTLLRTIAGTIPPLAGSVRLGSNVHLGIMTQEQKELDPEIDVLTTIRRAAAFHETDARAFLSQFLFPGDDVFIPVGKLSYGERARLSLACFVARGCNFLMLDEPINHLDIPSRSRFEQAMANFQGTVLAVVHDRFFIEGFADAIWEVKGGTVRRYGMKG